MIITEEIIGIIKSKKETSVNEITEDPAFYIGYEQALDDILKEVRRMKNDVDTLSMFGKLMGDVNNEV